jgi:hypothetical protein
VVHVARMVQIKMYVYKIKGCKPEGNRPLGRPRRRWEDNTKLGIEDIGCEGVDLIHLSRGRHQW